MWITLLLGLWPAVVVPVLLIYGDRSSWLAIFVYHFLCLTVPFIFRCSFSQAGLIWNRTTAWTRWTFLLSVSLLVISWLFVRFAGQLEFLMGKVSFYNGANILPQTSPRELFVLYTLCFNPFLEEFYWRGFLLPRTGIITGGIFFWFFHFLAFNIYLSLLDAFLLSLPILFAGWFWGWMRHRFQTLWPCVITHLAADAAILYAMNMLIWRSTKG